MAKPEGVNPISVLITLFTGLTLVVATSTLTRIGKLEESYSSLDKQVAILLFAGGHEPRVHSVLSLASRQTLYAFPSLIPFNLIPPKDK